MKGISKLNPAKSLFFRVFLWFWLATLLIFISSVWLANQLGSEAKYRPLNSMQQKDLMTLTNKVQKQIERRDSDLDFKKLLNKVSNRSRFGLVLFDPATRSIVHRVSRHRGFKDDVFDDFELRSSPLMLDVKGLSFIGPGLIKANQRDYMLFMVEPRPGGSLRVMRHEYPGIFILFMISLSVGLCYLFVRGLLNPIAQLSLASKQMADGEMGVRVGNASRRLDEIGQLGRDFNYMSEQVESLLTSQKRLLADISHELRSPLTRLQLSIGIALQQNESDMSANMLAALERIEKESQQIENMIAQVLLLSRLDNKQPIQNLQSVSLEQIMTPIIEDAQFEAAQKNKELFYQAEENISLYAEPQLLSSAIENILRNAIYYSNHMIQVSVSKHDNHLEWIIEDDGEGIEESQLHKIFEAFYRESTARDRNSGGVGLGLAIAQHAIVKHQGCIEANNKPEGGLRVKICIPLAAV
ncbi:ATP-binding protein [uncultured Paraglaciecola sp.]|uniref:ATP-binding protein n=1 Tax=uncultured Paraglaciecola sp. TaxID=1765024 RepID=UPI0030D8AF4D|tara:strand:- start:15959 stop:17365 length:1407 start_codon:yes stop_codon:yes gene_type:complete